jgi:branched-chain amino acid transport system substrate-binding protein
MNIKKFTKTLALGAVLLGSAAAAESQTLKIGVISPLTGGAASVGMAAAEAAKMIAADYNAKGGLESGGKKFQVQVIAYDDQYKAADSIAAYRRLLTNDGVKIMIIQTSPAAVALKQFVEDDKVAAICSCASPNAVDANSKYMFRMNSTPADYLPPMITWFKDNIKERRLVLINPNDEVGRPYVNVIEPLFKKGGFEVLASELVERDQKDFNPLFTKVIGLKPDVIDLGGMAPATTGLMVRQARELGYKGLFIKTASPSPREIVTAAAKEAAEGMLLNLFADLKSEGFRRIAARYRASVGQEPNDILVTSYDGISVLFKAIEKSGDPNDTAKIMAAFSKALPMKSIQGDDMKLGGKNTIGADMQVMSTEYIGVIKNGEPVVLGKVQ